MPDASSSLPIFFLSKIAGATRPVPPPFRWRSLSFSHKSLNSKTPIEAPNFQHRSRPSSSSPAIGDSPAAAALSPLLFHQGIPGEKLAIAVAPLQDRYRRAFASVASAMAGAAPPLLQRPLSSGVTFVPRQTNHRRCPCSSTVSPFPLRFATAAAQKRRRHASSGHHAAAAALDTTAPPYQP